MPYITKPDLNRVLPSEDRLDLLTDSGSGPDDTIWEDAAQAAISYMRSGLNGRYDVATIFAQTGSNRMVDDGAIVLAYTLDMAVSFIYKKVMPDKVPESIMQQTENIRLWLKGVNEFKINPVLPTKAKPQQDQILYGGDAPRQNTQL